MEYFDYKKVAREAKIPPDKLRALSKIIREAFSHDDMMYELHLLRACKAIRDGLVSIDEAIHPKTGAKV